MVSLDSTAQSAISNLQQDLIVPLKISAEENADDSCQNPYQVSSTTIKHNAWFHLRIFMVKLCITGRCNCRLVDADLVTCPKSQDLCSSLRFFFPKIINTDNVYVIYCDFRFIVKNSDGRFNRKK